ncbi:MAG: DUF2188 domain-containing protein [Steroidobacteraceae bacterium]
MDGEFFIERRPEGDYAIRKPNSDRASAVEPTQAEAIARGVPLFLVQKLTVGERSICKGLRAVNVRKSFVYRPFLPPFRVA